MSKTKEELNNIKSEYKELADKLKELSEEEILEVTGGVNIWDISVKQKEKFEVNTNDTSTWLKG